MDLGKVPRIDNNKVMVPIIVMKRNERSFVLIGMIHVASPQFFETVMSRLLQYEQNGFQVLYEEVEGIPSAEKRELDLLFKGLQKYDLGGQLNHIHPHSSWKSADSLQNIQGDFDENDTGDEHSDVMSNPEKYLDEILLPQLKNPNIDYPMMETMIHQRDGFAVRTIINHLENSDVVTYWGNAHVPGIIKGLEQAGFTQWEVEWIQAIDMDKIERNKLD